MAVFEFILVLLLAVTVGILIVHLFVIAAVLSVRKLSQVNAFYTIYIAGCFADCLALINGVFVYCSLTGLLDAHTITSPFIIRLSQTIVWGSRFSQMLAALIIAFNRLTAVCCPLKHQVIWRKGTEFACVSIQIASIFAFGFCATRVLLPIRITSSFGGVMTSFDRNVTAPTTIWLFSICLQSGNGVLIIIFYLVIACNIRAALRAMSIRGNSYTESRRLHKIAATVCTLEIVSVIQLVVSTQLNSRTETSALIYVTKTLIFCSIPPFILLIFSRTVRERFTRYFSLGRRPVGIASSQMFTTEIVA